MFDGKQALTEFEDGEVYVVETRDGVTKGVWDSLQKAFLVKTSDGSARLQEPAFSNPDSDLVVWEKAR